MHNADMMTGKVVLLTVTLVQIADLTRNCIQGIHTALFSNLGALRGLDRRC